MDEEKNTRMLKMAVIFIVIFMVILLGAMTGLTYAVVALSKDTKVRGWLQTLNSRCPNPE